MTTTVSAPEDPLTDTAIRERVWAHATSGRPYVPQSLRGYLTGRVLDIIVVVAATTGLTKATDAILSSTTIMAPEWVPVAVFCTFLLTIVFLYGGIAGTVGTFGERATRMRVVTIDDGSYAGFLGGGLRAIGWLFYVLFALMLSDTSSRTETRFVAVRTHPAGSGGQHPLAAVKTAAPHTDQS